MGTGHVEPVVVLGCEALHQLMLFDLYGYSTARTQEIHRITMEMLKDVPSPVFQVQKGFGAQLFGDPSTVQEVLHRFGSRPELLIRSMTGDHLLRDFADMVARAGATTYAMPAYLALAAVCRVAQRRRRAQRRTAGRRCARSTGRAQRRRVVRGPSCRATPSRWPDRCRRRRCSCTAWTTSRTPSNVPAMATSSAPNSPPSRSRRRRGGNPDVLRAEADSLAATTGVMRPGRQTGSPREAPDSPNRASMRRDGPIWMVASPLGEARLPDSNGLRQLARLLSMPAVEVTAVELAGHAERPDRR